MIEIARLSKENVNSFQKFIRDNPLNSRSLWLGASIGGIPCGIIQGYEDQEKTKNCSICNLFVAPPVRKEGVATALLDEFLKICKDLKYERVIFDSVASKESIEKINPLLCKFGFEPINIEAHLYTFNNLQSLLENRLIKYSINSVFTNINGIKIVPLDKADPKLIDNVINKVGIEYPEYYSLDPKNFMVPVYHINTHVAVSDTDGIVGWLTALDINGEIIYYKSFFVREDYRPMALGFYLMCSCVKRHADKYPHRHALCGISLKNPMAEKFNSMFFKGVDKKVSYEFVARKYLYENI